MITHEEIATETRRVIAGRHTESVLDMAEALEADGYSAEEIQEAVAFACRTPLRGISVRKLPTVRTVRLGRPS